MKNTPLFRKLSANSLWKNHPRVLQYPCQSLFHEIHREKDRDSMIKTRATVCDQLLTVRDYYEYPGLSAVQLGYNFPAFVVSITPNTDTYILSSEDHISDGKKEKLPDFVMNANMLKIKKENLHGIHICISPEYIWMGKQTCWAWEACASYSFLLHYIERPKDVIVKWVNVDGKTVVVKLAGMGSRLFQHEMDHLNGFAFYKRTPNISHAVPTTGFRTMSMWKNDFPSIEARSTCLYTLFTPPFSFISETPVKSAFLERTFDEEIYPGVQYDEAMCEQFHHVL